ncbi:MAG TPA: class I SAM-dependent methyltransferase [Bryobacteraceae bacterium]|jgi:ubiquinone/menaquinone biosynthesis C-methylase UbiE|nr:class I SAM-dependent methyltransferase [Bryobacteraceae bacterium]
MTPATSDKAYKGMGMEGFTARWYASLTLKSLDEFKSLARRIAGTIPHGSAVLEVAPGPGYCAIELAKLDCDSITGLDISRSFVSIARDNAERAGVAVDFRQGDAAHMPFPDQSFDFLLCRAAFKNFTHPVQALQEMYRVLKPGGRALIIDLRKDATMDSINQAVGAMHLNSVNRVLTRLTFRFVLLKRAYTRKDFERMLAQTKFGPIDIQQGLIGFELWLDRTA